MPRKKRQSSAGKAVTLLSFRFHSLVSFIHIYPAICRAVRTPPQNSAKAKKLGRGRAARKSPHFISREIISLCFCNYSYRKATNDISFSPYHFHMFHKLCKLRNTDLSKLLFHVKHTASFNL